MGQYYSTANTGIADSSTDKRVDYYELLQVARNASGEEKALELHPDKNFGNVENATKLFAEVQAAYEVLSDPQERAWYDSHRDAVLGNDGRSEDVRFHNNTRITTADDIFRLFSRFSPQMEFSDSPEGFYGGLREVFSRLALEEELDRCGERTDTTYYPTFGHRDDDYEEVVRPFYAVWSSFSTRKTFAWKDIYRYAEAPDRRVRRLMEKENKRLREEGVREFNDAVRSLVAFVKKRDPRYRSSVQSESQRQEFLRRSTAAQAAKSRAVNQAKFRDYVAPEWARSEDYYENDSDGKSSTAEASVEILDCVVCAKSFKSAKQFEAHERSKKHIKAVKQLQRDMRAEDEQLGLANDLSTHDGQQANAVLYNTATSTSDANSESPSISPNHNSSNRELDTISDYDTDYAPRDSVRSRLQPVNGGIREASDTVDNLAQYLSASQMNEPPLKIPKKLGKAKQKRLRKAQQAEGQPQGIICTTCGVAFASRSQMFSHIKKFNHARPQVQAASFKR
ncbi:putative C2H2 finger domain protein [Aspergillus homomorphus CBS 101889]|uniref:DnaJ-domain-containing protein n=1 Tax=Aspergillus homomorphus (strain CBS 101889) TaxID=1450537 RepID=A0A395HKS0_ASPHC|nr:DnaJ-domain-containing protein [Aspergillus homomorphus CBS 101889]RAL08437.1 DnaJ-domain-containing protein [Aspergillus homomorphus CBS 101889]